MKNLWRNFEFGMSILKSKLFNDVKPFQVQFSITNRCNLRCSYCYADYPERKQRELTTEEIKGIIDQLRAIGTFRINLVGGEPLIRPDIGEIVDHIKLKGIQCAMTSNGYLAEKKLDVVKKLDLLTISVDGDEKANDANRGEGSYKKAMEAVSIALENKIPLQVAAVLNRNSIGSIKFLLEKGKQMGFAVGFSTLISQTVDGVKQEAPDAATDAEYRQVIKDILELKKEGYPVLFSAKSLRASENWKPGYEKSMIMGEEPDFPFIKCYAGRFYCIIDVNGDIYPCPSLVDVFKPLNCLTHGVKKAFEHASGHNCMACHIPCQNEFNLLYSLNPDVITNAIKNYAGKGA